MQGPRIAICIPSYGTWHALFATDLISAICQTVQAPELSSDAALQVFNVQSSILPSARSELAKQALDWGATHLWWLDADMRFPPDALLQLLRRNLPWVGANYVARTYPHVPTTSANGRKFSSAGRTGTETVTFMGLGCALIRADVFRAVERPWFMFGYIRSTDQYVGEDVHLAMQAANLGMGPHVDHDLSQDVRHIGDISYGLEAYQAVEEIHQEAAE